MQSVDSQFSAKALLDSLRVAVGDSDFGYRMQALYAHVLLAFGAKILEINSTGHPDIKAIYRNELILVQVKSILHSGPWSIFKLTQDDLVGIHSALKSKGYLAVLDCAEPVSWIILDAKSAKQFLNVPVSVAALQGAQNSMLSEQFTCEFLQMLFSVRDRLPRLTYPLLATQAKSGQRLVE